MDKMELLQKFATVLIKGKEASTEAERVEILGQIADIYDTCASNGLGTNLDRDAARIREQTMSGSVAPHIYESNLQFFEGATIGLKFMIKKGL